MLLLARQLRLEGTHALLGRSDRGPLGSAVWLSELEGLPLEGGDPTLAQLRVELSPELEALSIDGFAPIWGVRGRSGAALGEMTPIGALGDEEPGLASGRAQVELTGSSQWLELRAAPELQLDPLSETGVAGIALPAYWAGLRRGPVRLGFGAETRWLGPGRRGAMIIADDAAPWPAGSLSGEGRLGRLGLARGEISTGWLTAERRDVQRPGVLHMDARWSPHPWVEVGGSRLSLFGGEGRPLPPIGQLLLPTEPHVYDDPDREEPDQDEIAALDGRLTIPLSQLAPPLDYVEGYLYYGGEDIIGLRLGGEGGLPYPSLAGVANLRGLEVAAGPLTANVEWARFMDDYFRWYVGHRIYHEGFTQGDHYLGHPNGGDQETWWFGLTWTQPDAPVWGAQIWGESVWRVDVADVVEDTVFVAMTDEDILRGGGRVWWYRPTGGRWALGVEAERRTGADFVPGAVATGNRIWLEWTSAPWTWRP